LPVENEPLAFWRAGAFPSGLRRRTHLNDSDPLDRVDPELSMGVQSLRIGLDRDSEFLEVVEP
ncbi:hypothetical protein ACTHSL_13900, partial [Neisseria sp. P0008.S010]|uniref:hypothetical protein n=1 Tax=Neisseria sp. P0008.S010 TaxID=3436707 RepID=UPI003F802E9E